MKDCTNGGCQCTPNQSISCTVNNCAHHCQDSNYCGLTSIRVGTHEAKPIPAAQSILISEVLEAIEEFEPRAEVENVTFELGERPGTLIPIVEVKIIDGDE